MAKGGLSRMLQKSSSGAGILQFRRDRGDLRLTREDGRHMVLRKDKVEIRISVDILQAKRSSNAQ
jgi:hypothetical protein